MSLQIVAVKTTEAMIASTTSGNDQKQFPFCCYITVCGRKLGCMDLTFGGLTLVSLSLNVASYFTTNYYVQIANDAIILAEGGLGYFYFRKAQQLGSIHQQDVDLNRTDIKLDHTADKTDAIIQKLEEELKTSKELNSKYEQETQNWDTKYQKVHQDYEALEKEGLEAKKTIANSESANEQLKKQVSQLQETLKTFKAALTEYNTENDSFKRSLNLMDLKTAEFEKTENKLVVQIHQDHTLLNQDVADLGNEIQKAIQLSQQIIGVLNHQLSTLQTDLKELKEQTEKLTAVGQTIEERELQLQTLIETTERQKTELASLQKLFVETSAKIDQERQELSKEREALESSAKKLAQDQQALNSKDLDFSDDAKRIEELTKRMEAVLSLPRQGNTPNNKEEKS